MSDERGLARHSPFVQVKPSVLSEETGLSRRDVPCSVLG